METDNTSNKIVCAEIYFVTMWCRWVESAIANRHGMCRLLICVMPNSNKQAMKTLNF